MALVAVDARVLQDSYYTGVSYYLYHLLKTWHKSGDASLFHLYGNKFSKFSYQTEIKKYQATIYHLPNKVLNTSLLLFKYPVFEKYIKEDILWLPNLNYYNWPRSKKLILSVHDLSFIHFPEFFSYKRRLWHHLINFKDILKKASHIITDSEFTKNDIISTFGINSNKIFAIPLGIDDRFFDIKDNFTITNKLSSGRGLPEKYIAFLGTLEPRKNLIGLIFAFNHLAKDDPDLNLVIGGAIGWLAGKIIKSMKDSPFASRIHYFGYLSFIDKIKILANAKVFAWPSFYEGFGLPPLEAMACGCPVVASTAGSLPEVLNNKALLINPFQTIELAQAIKEVIEDNDLALKLKADGINYARNFNWQKTAAKTLAVIKQ